MLLQHNLTDAVVYKACTLMYYKAKTKTVDKMYFELSKTSINYNPGQQTHNIFVLQILTEGNKLQVSEHLGNHPT